jgi:hypothetical protein
VGPTARRRPAHGTPGDRPPAVPTVSAAAPASITARPSASRRVRQSPGGCHSHRPERRALSGLAPPRAASANPADLAARAKLEGRPEMRAANLRDIIRGEVVAGRPSVTGIAAVSGRGPRCACAGPGSYAAGRPGPVPGRPGRRDGPAGRFGCRPLARVTGSGHRHDSPGFATRYGKRDYLWRGTAGVASIRSWLRRPVP